MGRSPCCSKEGVNRGAWTALEDKILIAYIKAHGEGKWRNLPKRAGLKRCGKSCRLRWLNYLRPDIKRGNISHDEEELIIRLHNLLGNRWSLIAGRLPGRTDNEIKNYWNTTLRKKVEAQKPSSSPIKKKPIIHSKANNPAMIRPLITHQSAPSPIRTRSHVVHTKASRCTKVIFPTNTPQLPIPTLNNNQKWPLDPTMDNNSVDFQTHQNHLITPRDLDDLMMDLGTVELGVPHSPDTNFMSLASDDFQVSDNATRDHDNNSSDHQPLPFDESMLENWTVNDCFEPNDVLDLGTLTSFLDSQDWP